jgi:hypothetical protein
MVTRRRSLAPVTLRQPDIRKGIFDMTETSIDRASMGRLAKALAFISGPSHPATVALNTAAETGTESDIKAARRLFLKLKPSDRQAALKMIED